MKFEIQPKRIKHVAQKPWEFLVLFLTIFLVIATVLFIIDFVPEPKTETPKAVETGEVKKVSYTVDVNAIAAAPVIDAPRPPVPESAPLVSASSQSPVTQPSVFDEAKPTGIAESPVRIVVMKVGVDTPILNPVASDIASLDEALLDGAVRYPQSSFLNESGDILLFGHQSYLPVVHNEAFKAFSDLQKLEEGDQVIVYSDVAKYYYRVRSIELAKASDGRVQIEAGKPVLTLVTCNSLGAKEDRYIIKADFVSKVSLDS